MKDSFGRKINYLRISITDLCNLRCKYCMPQDGVEKCNHDDILTLEEIEQIAKVFVSLGVDKIRLTGGEPLARNGILNLIKAIGSMEGVKDFAMTTNGLLLKNYAKDLKDAGLNRVNISLDTLNEAKYREITRGGELSKVLEGIEAAKDADLLPLKLNVVIIGGFNDVEIEDFVNLTLKEEIDVRFIELMPIGEAADWAVENFVSNEIVLDKFDNLVSIEGKDKSSPAVYYKLPGAKGKIGIINPISCKFCDFCNRVRITSQGKLKLCLHSNEEIDLKKALRNGEDLKEIIINAINNKPESHNLENGKYIDRNMYQIGG